MHYATENACATPGLGANYPTSKSVKEKKKKEKGKKGSALAQIIRSGPFTNTTWHSIFVSRMIPSGSLYIFLILYATMAEIQIRPLKIQFHYVGINREQ